MTEQSKALAITEPQGVEITRGLDFTGLERLARACAASGYFKDTKDVAQAYVKVVAGAELGVGPVQAMTGIHIVQGKPTLSAALVGALIKRSGRYDYRVRSLTDEECALDFYERGQRIGDSTFTAKDAQTAGLTGNPTWKKFPRNMLLSRALTNGARWYCPDVFGGAIYTPDELDESAPPEIPSPLGAEQTTDGLAGVTTTPERALPADGGVDAAEAVPISEAVVVEPEPEEAKVEEPKIDATKRRLIFARAREHGLDEAAVKRIVKAVADVDSTNDIPLARFDDVVAALEAEKVEVVA